ncbi:hypothetical protein NKY66_30790 [Sinorhizobium meliloti]|uniref:hypothetical protein n=1 Tax=Rhizobium meliloti TaxID=382 RepID=UPI003D6615D7
MTYIVYPLDPELNSMSVEATSKNEAATMFVEKFKRANQILLSTEDDFLDFIPSVLA